MKQPKEAVMKNRVVFIRNAKKMVIRLVLTLAAAVAPTTIATKARPIVATGKHW